MYRSVKPSIHCTLLVSALLLPYLATAAETQPAVAPESAASRLAPSYEYYELGRNDTHQMSILALTDEKRAASPDLERQVASFVL